MLSSFRILQNKTCLEKERLIDHIIKSLICSSSFSPPANVQAIVKTSIILFVLLTILIITTKQQQLSENQTWPEKRKGYLQLHGVAFQTLMTFLLNKPTSSSV